MQRELLIAYKLLFEEFVLDDGPTAPLAGDPAGVAPAQSEGGAPSDKPK
jgi:hypothetical protein